MTDFDLVYDDSFPTGEGLMVVMDQMTVTVPFDSAEQREGLIRTLGGRAADSPFFSALRQAEEENAKLTEQMARLRAAYDDLQDEKAAERKAAMEKVEELQMSRARLLSQYDAVTLLIANFSESYDGLLDEFYGLKDETGARPDALNR